MKNILVFFLLIFHFLRFFPQEVRPEIKGTLNTGELLTGVYNGNIFLFGNSYVWHTARDTTGSGIHNAGKYQVYRVQQEDAGKFIRFGVTTFSKRGKKETYYSIWNGPIKNGNPVISGEVNISGTLRVKSTVTATYHYSEDNNPESGSTFRWYLAESSSGANSVLISSSGSTLTLLPYQESRYIRVEVTPRDIYGNTGANYSSKWYGPVLKAEEINRPPVAVNVRIRGNPVYCGVLTGLYDYADADMDPEGQSSYRWLRAPVSGGNPVPIPGAVTDTYTVTGNDKGMYLYFEVLPRAASGTADGIAVVSPPTGMIQGNLPSVTFSGSNAVCEGASTVLTLTFSGIPPFNLEYTNGFQNFNLSTSNYTYPITVSSGGIYKGIRLTDILNCPVTDLPSTAEVTIKPKPRPDFTVDNTCYTGDSTLFRNNTPSKSTITTWSWKFGDSNSPANENVSAVLSPKHKFSSAGKYMVTLAASGTNGCRDTLTKAIQLGGKPVADFIWDKECFAPDLTATFNSKSTGQITKYQWSIRDESSFLKGSADSEFSYAIPSAGKYNVSLKISTDLGCEDSIVKIYRVKPVIHLKDSMYSDSFEKDPKNWNTEQSTGNNWFCGSDSSHSGKYAWYTVFPETRKNQQLVISSSCFDFTGLDKPFIDIWINYKGQESKEGAVLQYLQDGATSWLTVGEPGTGINWYNHNNIESSPGHQNSGWSGNSGGWLQARHSLDFPGNRNNIRFRIVYASLQDVGAGSFVFDDIFIGERGKKVLVEHFTNLSDALSMQSNISVDSILAATGLNAVGIQYHTSFPGPDSLNGQNKANPAARALFYGIGKVPVSYLDGGASTNYIFDYSSKKINVSDISNRSFEDPGFDLSITSSVNNNIMEGIVRTTALKDQINRDISLYVAITEDIDISVAGKTQTLRNVLKYMYPSSAGLTLRSDWTKYQAADVRFSWPVSHAYNLFKLKAVAFIQDNRTREVYQVNMAANSSVTTLHSSEAMDSVKIYPNPAVEKIIISFGHALRQDGRLQLISPSGKVLNDSYVKKGISITELPVNDYPSGIYYLKIFSGGKTKIEKIVITK